MKIQVNKVTKDIKNALKDCLINLFYKKEDLIDFLKETGCSSQDLKNINTSLTKSEIINIYFSNLDSRSDFGTLPYHYLITHLIDWRDFNSYWFERGYLSSKIAKLKIENLKYLVQEKTEIENNRLKKREREQEVEKVRFRAQKLEYLKDKFYKMCTNPEGSQRRGYDLEVFLQDLFGFFEFDVYKPFKVKGEQIDGSIKFEGENYILEAKWQDVVSTNESLYNFAYKIESNILYPRGLFISIQGYSVDAISKITFCKKPQLILFDAVDIVAVLEQRIELPKLLSEKIRYAQTRSEIYYNANSILSSS